MKRDGKRMSRRADVIGVIALAAVTGLVAGTACSAPAARRNDRSANKQTGPAQRKYHLLPEERTYVEEFLRLCDAGDAGSCLIVANAYRSGRSVVRNDARAEDAFRKASEVFEASCLSDDLEACYKLGRLYSWSNGAVRNVFRGAYLTIRACESGHILACRDAGIAYLRGMGVAENTVRAYQLFRRVCEDTNTQTSNDAHVRGDACAYLGGAFRYGIGIAEDRVCAKLLFQKACMLGHAQSCSFATGLDVPPPYGRGVAPDIPYASADRMLVIVNTSDVSACLDGFGGRAPSTP